MTTFEKYTKIFYIVMSLIVEPGCSKVRNIKLYQEFGSHFQLWERLFCIWPIFLGSLHAFFLSNGI